MAGGGQPKRPTCPAPASVYLLNTRSPARSLPSSSHPSASSRRLHQSTPRVQALCLFEEHQRSGRVRGGVKGVSWLPGLDGCSVTAWLSVWCEALSERPWWRDRKTINQQASKSDDPVWSSRGQTGKNWGCGRDIVMNKYHGKKRTERR